MRRFFRDNGLSIVLVVLFLTAWVGQSVAGHRAFNEEQRNHQEPEVGYGEYLRSSHFLEATAENWESEFLQMAGYVLLTVYLFQRGSSESKDPDKKEEPVDREPDPRRKGAPWAVRRGGWVLSLYNHSLALALFTLFLISFVMHAVGGAGEYNQDQAEHGQPQISVIDFMRKARFWFESLQNWQSEFLAVLSIVVLSIFLRQKGSPESKPVDAAHKKTGIE